MATPLPAENRTITLKDGRDLGFTEYGAPTGRPVFFFHGSASSRLDRPLSAELLTRMNIRFISVDRPVHGLSSFQPDRRLLDWPRDVAQLTDDLGIGAFYVAGHSAGGPHALVVAHRLSERAIAGALLSSVAPMNRPQAYEGMPVINRILAKSARWAPWITKTVRRFMRWMALRDVETATRRLMTSIPDADKRVLYNPQNLENMVLSIREGFRSGYLGVALDDILVNGDWGFDLQEVKPRIDIWHGEADVNVPTRPVSI